MGCVLWHKSLSSTGYGNDRLDGKRIGAHRRAYIEAKGPIPEGMVIDHLCRNKACVNPDHLEAVPQRENILRGSMSAKLDWEKVRVIRASAKKGTELAAEYGVTPQAISQIRRNQTWVA